MELELAKKQFFNKIFKKFFKKGLTGYVACDIIIPKQFPNDNIYQFHYKFRESIVSFMVLLRLSLKKWLSN